MAANEDAGDFVTTGREQAESEGLKLQNSDHPGMSLVSTPLDGNNYLSWSRAIKIALGAKMKLNFINGRCERPSEDADIFEQWQRVDCMVTSWILNSISKQIVEAFLYTTTARELWLELEARFGECNGPLIYQLQREISSISQGEMSIMAYYTKLKRLWDELACVTPLPSCACGSGKAVADFHASNQLMQLLMGLNDSFDHVRNQILVMEPLPNATKAYSMLLRVEKQRQIQVGIAENMQHSAMQVRGPDLRKNDHGRFGSKKKFTTDRKQQYCVNCEKPGHVKETCFKLHGYPDGTRISLNRNARRPDLTEHS